MTRIILTIAALLAPSGLSAQGLAAQGLAAQGPAAAQRPAAQDRVDADVLMRDMTTLAADDMAGRGAGTDGGTRARDYIERRFAQLGLEVHRTPFNYPGGPGSRSGQGANIWVLVQGSERPDKVIVVGAHYDHVGTREREIFNGADDNASGTAALFAIAQALKRTPPRHSVMLVAFDAEELGLFGSRVFVQAPPVPVANILLNINLDMVARGSGDVLWAAGPRVYPALRPVVEAAGAAAAAGPVSLRFGHDRRPARPGRGGEDLSMRSDQAAFGMAGIPWIFFTTGMHADYHKPSDDSERVNAAFYSGVVTLVLDTLRRLDGDAAALDAARRDGDKPRWR